MIKAVLIDDEYYALQGLRMELEEIGGVAVAAMYEDGRSALEGIAALNPDIIFLDIEMPGSNGLELFQKILETQKNPDIVFVTAFDQYAVQAFELNALDYLLKPVQQARLIKTLERIKKRMIQGLARPKITFRCFRHFSVLLEGKEFNSGWRTRKAQELLAYLICEKGRFVAKEKIADALWPELDRDKSIANLYLAYYYLKKQFESSGLALPIESERGKMRIDLTDAECDLIQFDCLYEVCRNINHDNMATAEKAAAIYQGTLLEDSYYPWASEIQQRYEVAYGELVKRITSFSRQTKIRKNHEAGETGGCG